MVVESRVMLSDLGTGQESAKEVPRSKLQDTATQLSLFAWPPLPHSAFRIPHSELG